MIELYENLSEKEADLCSLILKASFIPHRVKKQARGYAVYVDEHLFDQARDTIEQYFIENRMDYTLPGTEPEAAEHGYAGIWMAVFLGAIHFYVQSTGASDNIWRHFGASAALINEGELFRTITALMLHADTVHLVGNMAGMAVFGTAVAQVAGWGVGFLMILLAGAFGNFINAVMYQDAHLSIGASTAVFGAVGILSAYQFVRRRRKEETRFRTWLPVLGGVALLGFLGAGAHVDLGAHLFGFLAGMAVGGAYTVLRPAWGKGSIQWACASGASGLVIFSWVAGYLAL